MAKKITTKNIRVRMAPSPTGPFHIGSARTAFFNYLFAKKYKGKFIIRIEDTDKERSKKEWEDNIKESLEWMGLSYDEGFEKGEFGPYRQSERGDIYKKNIEKLLLENKAYYCFCSQEDLEADKQNLLSQGIPAIYSGKCSRLSKEDSKEKIEQGIPFVIRLRTKHKIVSFDDLLRGKIEYDASTFGDTVIAKNLEEPLYNLACVIDDYEMKISYVVRGEEHIPNTPKQLLIAEALGIKNPEYLHLPLILNQQRAKLSKRDPSIQAKVLSYKEEGYLPEAMINFLAFLGWSPGDNREIFTMDELIKEFSIEKLQKAGAVFNVQKLDWLNGYYIRHLNLMDLTDLCLPYLKDFVSPMWDVVLNPFPTFQGTALMERTPNIVSFKNEITGENYLKSDICSMIALYQERLKKLSEIGELIDFFFLDELGYSKEILKWKKMEMSELPEILNSLYKILETLEEGDWNKERLEKLIMPFAEKTGDRGKVLWPLRVALCGKESSAGPFEIAEVLGKRKCLLRLHQAIKKFF